MPRLRDSFAKHVLDIQNADNEQRKRTRDQEQADADPRSSKTNLRFANPFEEDANMNTLRERANMSNEDNNIPSMSFYFLLYSTHVSTCKKYR